jgi:predicted NAD/FAD-binding protein
MDAHSIDLGLDDGLSQRIDLPPRMFNRDEWPLLTELYRALGVKTQAVDATKSFAIFNSNESKNDVKPWLKLGDSYFASFAPRHLLNPKARLVARETKRIHERVSAAELTMMPSELTFKEYLSAGQFDDAFVYDFLLPGLSATVFTCSYAAIENYPAKVVLASLLNQFDRAPLQRTTFGTRDVVRRLTASIDDIRLGENVLKIAVTDTGVSVIGDESSASRYDFDHLVFATQANSAIGLLGQDYAEHKALLEGFCYEKVPVVVHSDASFIASSDHDRVCFNFESDVARQNAMCTILLNKFYPEANLGRPLFQTIRPIRAIAASEMISQVVMQRPVVDVNTHHLIQSLRELQMRENNRIWFCGSYAAPGVPLLESGVASARFVADRLGCPVDFC